MKEIWFKRKRYGWGWTPANLRGWIITLLYVALTLTSALVAPVSILTFIVLVAVFTAGFMAICFKYGETPRWQWGASSDSSKSSEQQKRK